MPPATVLVVDDYEPFRRFICTTLKNFGLMVVGEADDGLKAVERAEELQPDLILLDIGLPQLDGVRAAKRIRQVAPRSKIVFLSQETSPDVVEVALSLGALGYVHKTNAQSDILPAIESALASRRYVSQERCVRAVAGQVKTPVWHEALFYSEEAILIESVAGFIAAALRAGNPAIVVATESHRESFARKLEEKGIDVKGAVQKGLYVSLSVGELLPKIMINGVPEDVRFHNGLDAIVTSASEAAKVKSFRIALYGEGASFMCAERNPHAAIRLEKLSNVFINSRHAVDILCGYPLNLFHGDASTDLYENICKEHSAVRVQ